MSYSSHYGTSYPLAENYGAQPMKQCIMIELEAEKKVNLDKIEDPLKKLLEDQGAAIHFIYRANPVPEDEPDLCDECGMEYPKDASSMIGMFHKEECSLHGDPNEKTKEPHQARKQLVETANEFKEALERFVGEADVQKEQSTPNSPFWKDLTERQQKALLVLDLATEEATESGLFDRLLDKCNNPNSINDLCDAIDQFLSPEKNT